jgi:probable rRNA maturation factor
MDRKLYAEVDVQVAPALAESVSADHLEAIAVAALRHEKAPGQATIVVTDDDGIQELNRSFLGIDAPTDVLAFSAQENGSSFVIAPEAGTYLGDVVISYPRAIAQAGDAGHPVQQELNLLVVHGLLHLMGYDHSTEAGKTAMWARQDEILAGG